MKALSVLITLATYLTVFVEAKVKSNGQITRAYREALLSEPDVVQFFNEIVFIPG